MGDTMPLPPVDYHVKSGKFTLNVYAYRSLTESELLQATAEYKQRKHIRKFPASGSDDFICLLGYNPADDI